MIPEDEFESLWNARLIVNPKAKENYRQGFLVGFAKGRAAGVREAAEYIDDHCQMDATELRRRVAVGET